MKIKMEHASKQQLPEQSLKSFDQVARAKFNQKEILFHMMRKNKSFEKHPTYQALYDALMQSLILDEDEMENAKIVESPTQKKRHHDDGDQEPLVGPDQGPKSTSESKQEEEIVFEATNNDIPLNQGDDMGNTNEQPDVEAVTKDDWFKKPKRPLTPDPE
uniref:Uncharacterized protein n=1 Tax=Tanacetum cinerariifolium TaxID=118510 RepID=A0A6L2JCK5_TANCI|nr:hypothetical protein [Tanacetum cinerariifolium]